MSTCGQACIARLLRKPFANLSGQLMRQREVRVALIKHGYEIGPRRTFNRGPLPKNALLWCRVGWPGGGAGQQRRHWMLVMNGVMFDPCGNLSPDYITVDSYFLLIGKQGDLL